MKLFSSLLVAAMLPCAASFVLPTLTARGRASAATMGMFDGFAKAFENDSSLGTRQNAGLSKEKAKKTVTWMGPKGQKKQATCVPGQKLRDIARGSGIPIRYDCNEGTCKTCEAMVGGSRTKICVGRMPNKDVTIKYNIRG